SSSQNKTQPVLERPVCLVRAAIYIQDYIQGQHPCPSLSMGLFFIFFETVSEILRDRETVTCASALTTLGGKGVLQAISISRAGQRVELAGALGRDGDYIPAFLASVGVGTRGCGYPTGTEASHRYQVSLLIKRRVHLRLLILISFFNYSAFRTRFCCQA